MALLLTLAPLECLLSAWQSQVELAWNKAVRCGFEHHICDPDGLI